MFCKNVLIYIKPYDRTIQLMRARRVDARQLSALPQQLRVDRRPDRTLGLAPRKNRTAR